MLIYRAISEAEKNDLESCKIFKSLAGCYEGKLFAATHKDASIFGKHFYPFDQRPFFIVEVEIDDIFSKKLGYEYPDQALGVDVTIAVDRDLLQSFNLNMTFTITHYVSYE